MAKGFGFAKKRREARPQGNSVWSGKLIFKLPDDGDTALVHFLPDEDGDVLYGALHHEVPVEGRSWGYDVPCLAQDEDGNQTDDPCPGCENDLKLKEKYFVKVFWRDAPKYKYDDEGKLVKDKFDNPKVIGEEDQVAVWAFGPNNAENLEEIEENYGLTSRQFKVKRKGTGMKTTYSVIPHPIDEKVELDSDDKKVIKESDGSDAAIDLNDFIRPGSYEDFQNRLDGGARSSRDNDDDDDDEPTRKARGRNPFKRD